MARGRANTRNSTLGQPSSHPVTGGRTYDPKQREEAGPLQPDAVDIPRHDCHLQCACGARAVRMTDGSLRHAHAHMHAAECAGMDAVSWRSGRVLLCSSGARGLGWSWERLGHRRRS